MDYGHWDVSQFGEFDPDEFFGFIYEIEELSTGRSYIGKKFFRHKRKKTKDNPSKTKESDWKDYTSSCVPLQESIEEQGKEKFRFRIISLCSGRSQLTYEECQLQYTRDVLRAKLPNGEKKYFNKAIGHLLFAGVEKQTEETKKKISLAKRGPMCSSETRKKLSLSQIGKTHTPETKKKISLASAERTHTPEAKAKISLARMGRRGSPETRKKQSLAHIGQSRPCSPETRAKMRAARLAYFQRKSTGIPV